MSLQVYRKRSRKATSSKYAPYSKMMRSASFIPWRPMYPMYPIPGGLRQFPKGELKYTDITISNASDTTGLYTLLNGLRVGNAATQRIGQNISIRSIQYNLLVLVTAGTGTDQMARWAFVVDKQANAAAMTTAMYLTADSWSAFPLLEYRRRFKTIINKVTTLNATGEPNSFRLWRGYIKFKRPIVTEYNTADNGTIADIASNSLYLYNIGTMAPGVTAGTLVGRIRIRYSDM